MLTRFKCLRYSFTTIRLYNLGVLMRWSVVALLLFSLVCMWDRVALTIIWILVTTAIFAKRRTNTVVSADFLSLWRCGEITTSKSLRMDLGFDATATARCDSFAKIMVSDFLFPGTQHVAEMYELHRLWCQSNTHQPHDAHRHKHAHARAHTTHRHTTCGHTRQSERFVARVDKTLF